VPHADRQEPGISHLFPDLAILLPPIPLICRLGQNSNDQKTNPAPAQLTIRYRHVIDPEVVVLATLGLPSLLRAPSFGRPPAIPAE